MRQTDNDLGHAGPHDAATIEELQRKAAAATITNGELLRLALLQFEPAHDAFASVETLRHLLTRDPGHDLARVWIAYLFVYELMDEEALTEAVRVAGEVSTADRRLKAAAGWVKGTALRELGRIDDSVTALEESVRLEPEWVANRMALAAAYRDSKRKREAIEQLRIALENVQSSASITDNDLFEALISGRAPSSQIVGTINEEMRRIGG